MRVNVRAVGMPLTPEVRKRINWICKKLERTANVPDPNVLQCDIEVTAVERTLQEKRFQAEFETNARKAKDLAEKNGLLFFDHEEGLSTHDQTRSIGVTVPKERLEEIAGLMRNNTKYRPQP